MTLSLDAWLASPADVVEAVFADDGPAAAVVSGYVRNPSQVEYATLLALAAVRGADPAKVGKVSPIEGDTGLGKTLAILVVAGLTAVLRGKRALVTTYTRHLNRQLAGKDGSAARAIVEAVTGRPMRIAVRRPRSAFASPTLCGREATLLRNEALMTPPGEVRDALMASSRAMEALGAWTEREVARAAVLPTAGREAFAAGFGGLIETFVAGHPHMKKAVADVPYDHYTLDGNAKRAEHAAYDVYEVLAKDAHVLVATHAALVRSQSTLGNSLDPDGQGFSIVFVDEANRMDDAGQAALGVVRSLASYAAEPRRVQPLASKAADAALRLEIADLALEQGRDGEELLDNLAHLSQSLKGGASDHRVDAADAHWLAILRRLHGRSASLRRLLSDLGTDDARALVTRMERRDRDVEAALETVRREEGSRAYPKGEVPEDVRSHSSAWISFSPRNEDPSLQTRPKRGSRVVSNLWRDEQAPLADAVVITSATLSVPGLSGMNRNASALDAIGLTPSSPRINSDLARSVSMRRFGTLKGLVLAPPTWDVPTSRTAARPRDGSSIRSARWADGVGLAIADALGESWRPDRRSTVLVLCTSHADAALLGETLLSHADPDEVFVRREHMSVDDGFDWLAGRRRGAFLTAGAWDGVDRPGLIDHLVIPALPFPPGYHADWKDAAGEQRYGRSKELMLIRLRQGLGRPFRSASDVAKVWILDPRIGLPASMLEYPHPDSDRRYLDALPRRFERQLHEASIYDPAMGVAA